MARYLTVIVADRSVSQEVHAVEMSCSTLLSAEQEKELHGKNLTELVLLLATKLQENKNGKNKSTD